MTKTDSFELALTSSLQQICQSIGWQYGEVWFPDEELLRCHPAHYLASPQLTSFRRESEAFTFAAGAGLPGRVWLMRESEWIDNVSIEPAIYYRAYLAKKAGLKAALGVPILVRGEVLAILVFYSNQAQPPTKKVTDAFSEQVQSLMVQYRFQHASLM